MSPQWYCTFSLDYSKSNLKCTLSSQIIFQFSFSFSFVFIFNELHSSVSRSLLLFYYTFFVVCLFVCTWKYSDLLYVLLSSYNTFRFIFSFYRKLLFLILIVLYIYAVQLEWGEWVRNQIWTYERTIYYTEDSRRKKKKEFCILSSFFVVCLIFILTTIQNAVLVISSFIVLCRMLFTSLKKVVCLLFLIGGHVHLYLLVFLSFLLFGTEFSFNFHSRSFSFSVYLSFDVFDSFFLFHH